MIKTLKRIPPLRTGMMLGAFYVLISLIISAIILLVAIIGGIITIFGSAHSSQSPLAVFGGAIAMAICLPIIYGAMGFICGVIGAWVYNLVAKFVGGIQVEVE